MRRFVLFVVSVLVAHQASSSPSDSDTYIPSRRFIPIRNIGSCLGGNCRTGSCPDGDCVYPGTDQKTGIFRQNDNICPGGNCDVNHLQKVEGCFGGDCNAVTHHQKAAVSPVGGYLPNIQELKPACPGGNCGTPWSNSCPGGNCHANADHQGTADIHIQRAGGCPGGNCDAGVRRVQATPIQNIGACPGGNCHAGHADPHIHNEGCPGGNCGSPWNIQRAVSIPVQKVAGCPGGNCGTPWSTSCPGGNCNAGHADTHIHNEGGCPGGNCGAPRSVQEATPGIHELKSGCPGGVCGTSWSNSCPGGNCHAGHQRTADTGTQIAGGCPGGNCGRPWSTSCPGGNCNAGYQRAADTHTHIAGRCPGGNCGTLLNKLMRLRLFKNIGLTCPGGNCREKRSANPQCPGGNCRPYYPSNLGRSRCYGGACLRRNSIRCPGLRCRFPRSPVPWGFNSPCFKGGCNNRRDIPCVGKNCRRVPNRAERKLKSTRN